MFMKDEISGLKALYNDLENVRIDEFLTQEDIATIAYEADLFENKNNRKLGTPMAVQNLRNRMIVPKNYFRRCTVVMQRLHNEYDFGDWLEKIAKKILYNEYTQVKVGFSFLSWKPITNERTYLFSAKELAPFKYMVGSEDELLMKFSKIGSMSDSEMLNQTFIQSIPDNPFSKSGFTPLKIVCSYVYITK